MKTIVLVRSNPVNPDSRVEKESRALVSSGYKVKILAWDRNGDAAKVEKKDGAEIKRFKFRAPYGKLTLIFYLIVWGMWEFFALLFKKFDYVHACDFDTIIPAFLAARIKRKKVVYDVFDFYADSLPFAKGSLIYRFFRGLEIYFINHSDATIIVDDSRVEQIAPAKPKKLTVIYNTPEKISQSKIAAKKNGKLSIFYAGVLYGNRGIEEMIEAVSKTPKAQFTLAGFGEEAAYFEKLCKQSGTKFLGKIPYEKVIELSEQSDCLFATYDPKVPNHRYSSANKLFEAMMLAKPIIVARNTGMDKIVDKEKMGIVVEYGDIKQLIDALEELADKAKYSQYSKNARKAYSAYSWDEMKRRLISLYKAL